MVLREMPLDGGEQDWARALDAATSSMPAFSGSYDNRVAQVRGQQLLAALIWFARKESGPAATMENVRRLIDEDMSDPGRVLKELMKASVTEVREIASVCLAARGCWFGDAVPFLSLNISRERSLVVEMTWPQAFRDVA